MQWILNGIDSSRMIDFEKSFTFAVARQEKKTRKQDFTVRRTRTCVCLCSLVHFSSSTEPTSTILSLHNRIQWHRFIKRKRRHNEDWITFTFHILIRKSQIKVNMKDLSRLSLTLVRPLLIALVCLWTRFITLIIMGIPWLSSKAKYINEEKIFVRFRFNISFDSIFSPFPSLSLSRPFAPYKLLLLFSVARNLFIHSVVESTVS